ncbi:hypothetical protein HXX76_007515 [Chlamydomonas incerta]|uniref:Ubiquitin-like domain-containing protein n=1 Tax=Chlamydomonas incerta TaxID=51695 RepID=A0A835W0E1_CHLIN|nr:hypothetical protein HXX76_007515 [Chlamydomonas incerta]|eukprot:KAG2434620.1 hypothetical protein HXX76_007515 [Chlamydomonas incerta]
MQAIGGLLRQLLHRDASGAAANEPRGSQQREGQQQRGRPQEQQPGSEEEGIVQVHMYVVHPGDLNRHELAAELQLPRYMQLPDKRQLAYLPMADVQQRLCGRGVPPQAWRFFLLERRGFHQDGPDCLRVVSPGEAAADMLPVCGGVTYGYWTPPIDLYALDVRAPRMRVDAVLHGYWGQHTVERVEVDPAMSIRDFADQAAARLPPQHGFTGYFRLSSGGIPSRCCMMAAAPELRDGKADLFGIGPPPPGVQTFSIVIIRQTGNPIEVSGVYNNLFVAQLKDMVEQATGTCSDNQRLIFGCKQLHDPCTRMAEYGIGPGARVMLTLKLRGGKPVICVWAAQPTDVSVRLRLSRHWAFSSLVPRPDEYSSGSSGIGGGSGGGGDTATEAEGGKGGWAAGGREAAWRVRALPDGTLVHPGSGGREYAYLFWEALTEGSAVAAAVAAEASGGVAGGGGCSSRGSSRRSSCSNGTMVWEEQPEQAQQAAGDGRQLQLQPQARPATATANAAATAPAPAPAPAAAAITSPSSRLGLGLTPADLPLPDFQPTRSFCVAGADVEAWLYGALSAFGLPVRERTDFLTYWLPHMEGAAWLLISFADPADYEAAAALEVLPAPDVCVRLFMLFERLAAPVAGACGDLGAEAARVGVLRREGCSLAVLEWGGMEVVRAGRGRA